MICDACKDPNVMAFTIESCTHDIERKQHAAAAKARAEERAAVVALIDELIADHASSYDEDATHRYATPLRTVKRLLLACEHLPKSEASDG